MGFSRLFPKFFHPFDRGPLFQVFQVQDLNPELCRSAAPELQLPQDFQGGEANSKASGGSVLTLDWYNMIWNEL